MVSSINIRPGTKILSVLQHLNYQPWFALAEFVDNSIQSFLSQKEKLLALDNCTNLEVFIDIDKKDGGRITIRDNAGGISLSDYPRAFRPAEVPLNRDGLSEFGMGMKSAACWFSSFWKVRTSHIGESVQRIITFDLDKIVEDDIEELFFEEKEEKPNAHYTEIILEAPHHLPAGRTISKIKEHLSDIYRDYTRKNILSLFFNYEQLTYSAPKILCASYYENSDAQPVVWKKEINFDFGNNLKVTGFAAIREIASTSHSGFALFRRGRVIQGSADEGYRPSTIFGSSNSYAYQRLFGELHLEGFQVSHTKDGFRWDENEEPFLALLKDALNDDTLPGKLLSQVRNYRSKRKESEFSPIIVSRSISNTQKNIIEHLDDAFATLTVNEVHDDTKQKLGCANSVGKKIFNIFAMGEEWEITIDCSFDPSISDWIEVSDSFISENGLNDDGNDVRKVGVRLSLSHPFMDNFVGTSVRELEPILRLVSAFSVAETLSRSTINQVGLLRKYLNILLTDSFSKL